MRPVIMVIIKVHQCLIILDGGLFSDLISAAAVYCPYEI